MSKFDVLEAIATVPNYHEGQDAHFRCYTEDLISAHLQAGMVWEPHMHRLFEENIGQNSVSLDIGANIGTHSVKMAKLSTRLLAFEPLRPSYTLLKENLRINGCSNAVVYEYALSDAVYSTEYKSVESKNIGGSVLQDDHMTPGIDSIDVITLDSLYLNQVDFMKIDVEGYEAKAIVGAIETIKHHRPTIVLECWDTYPNVSLAHTMKEHELLLSLDYSLTQVSNCDWLFSPK
jgi:FkbM family methyltransferase